MRRVALLATTLMAWLVLLPAPAYAADPGVVTDDPAGERAGSVTGFDGAGLSSVTAHLGSQAPADRAQRKARNVSLLGALKLEPFNQGVHGDVGGFKNLAFIGKWRSLCPGTGVDIIDISNPAAPAKVADTLHHQNTSMEDMEAITIGSRDVLAVGLQDCGNPGLSPGKSGLELFDISDPSHPQLLSFFDVDQFGANVVGIHELHLTQTPSGRSLALASVPDLEALTSDEQGRGGTGDLLMIDISDPAHPTLAGEWGVLDEPTLGLEFYLSVRQGGDARTLLHSVRPNQNGTLAYLSYWDAGVILLDVTNPGSPQFLGRTVYPQGAEGNAHSVDQARGGNILVQADEDFSPFELQFTSSAFSGTKPAVEGAFTAPIVNLPGRAMAGQVVFVGRGCPAGSITGTNPEDPYLANPAGKIALIERGACRFDNKIGRAQLAGATGVIVFNSAAGGEGLVLMGGENPVTLPDGTVVSITIPGVFVQRSTGMLLKAAPAPVTVRAEARFNGWGFLRIFDIKDPAHPVQVGSFATPNTNNPDVATTGTFSVHNPEVRGNTIYASWYNDGLRVIDISQPSAPREIGSWTGAGAPDEAPLVNLWGVAVLGDLILVSDRNFGLYVLKQVP